MSTIIRLLSIVALASIVWILLPAGGLARDVYVDNVGGDDGASGEHAEPTPERSGPVHTLSKALQIAVRGDRIILKKNDKPYREPISLVSGRHSGFPSRPFMIVGNGAVIDGTAPVPERLWEHYRDHVYRFQPGRLRHQQLFLDGRLAVRVPVVQSAQAPPELKPLEWCLFRGYIYFAAEVDKRPENYNLTYAKEQTGVTLSHVNFVEILDLTVQGFSLDGVNAATGSRKINLTRMTCRGNGRSGISVGGASSITIEQCLVGDNGEAQLLTFPFSETKIIDSQFLPKSAPAWIDRGGRVYIDGEQVKGGREKIGNIQTPENTSSVSKLKNRSFSPPY